MPDETTPDEGVLSPDPGADDPAAELRARVESLEKEKQDTHERLLRTAADFDNFRKRSRKDADEARWKAREDVLKEMLPVIDNLERALAAAGEGGPVVDGVRLVLRQFQTALERFEVKGFPALGTPFDPTRHEAIAHLPTAEHPPGTVASEMQRGYMMGERLLRPALVAVARAPEGGAEDAPA
jgi:molecular chaperone GrpE